MIRFGAITTGLAILITVSACSSSTNAPSTTGDKPTFIADLRPANEVPPVQGPEASGFGTATITFDPKRDAAGNVTSSTVTFVVNLSGFPPGTPINIAHIHEGPDTCACPVVISTTLAASEGLTTGTGTLNFVKSNINVTVPEVVNRILANPSAFYFNVHSTANPLGVARGKLVRVQ